MSDEFPIGWELDYLQRKRMRAILETMYYSGEVFTVAVRRLGWFTPRWVYVIRADKDLHDDIARAMRAENPA